MTRSKGFRGFTVIELMLAVLVLAIIATLAAPSFRGVIERRRLQGAAEAIFTDLQFVKSEAIKRNKPIIMALQEGDPWCYGLDDDADGDVATVCDCADPDDDQCSINGVSRRVSGADYPGVTLDLSAGTSDELQYNPLNGLLADTTPRTFTLTVRTGTKTITLSPTGSIGIN